MKKIFWREVLEMLSEFVYLALIFFVPVYFAVWFKTYSIFELDKLVLFRTGVLLLSLLTVLRFLFWPEILENFQPGIRFARRYFLAPLTFLVLSGLVCLASSDLVLSFWGSYARQEGWLNFGFYILWLVLVVINAISLDNRIFHSALVPVRSRSDRIKRNVQKTIIVMVAAGALVSLYGCLQYVGIDFLVWPESPLLFRVFSSFGQPNFLASWLLFVLPLTFYLLKTNSGWWPRFWPLLILALELFCLFFTASRAAWLALVIVFCLFFLPWLWRRLPERRFGRLLAVVVSLVILAGVLAGMNHYSHGRLSTILKFQDGSVAARLKFWSVSLPAIGQKPLLGYGQDNYDSVFLRAYQPDWGVYGKVNAYTDRAHNLILDIWLAGGLVGFLAWLLLWLFAFRLWRDNRRRLLAKKDQALNQALGFGLLAFLLSLLFGFPFVAGQVYFFSLIALLVSLNFASSSRASEPLVSLCPLLEKGASLASRLFPKKSNLLPVTWAQSHEFKIILGIALSALAFWQISFQFNVLMAEHYFNALYFNLNDRQYFTAYLLDNYTDHTLTSPNNRRYYKRVLGEQLTNAWPGLIEVPVKRFGLIKLEQIEAFLPASGYENLLVKAKIRAILGDQAGAAEYWQSAQSLGRELPLTYLDAARIATFQGDLTAAISNYKSALARLPDFNNPAMNDEQRRSGRFHQYLLEKGLGDNYILAKEYFLAEQAYRAAFFANPLNFSLYKNIADTYYLRGNFGQAAHYNKIGWRHNPADYTWPLAISLSYQAAGDKVMSLEKLNQAIKLAPDNHNLERLRQSYLLAN